MTKEEDVAISDEYLDVDLVSLLDGTTEGKRLFYKFCKMWLDLLDCLDKEDRLILLKMIFEVYSYNECVNNIINNRSLA